MLDNLAYGRYELSEEYHINTSSRLMETILSYIIFQRLAFSSIQFNFI